MEGPPQGTTHMRNGYPATSRILFTPRSSVKTRVTSWEGDKGKHLIKLAQQVHHHFHLYRHDIRDIDFHCRSLLNQANPNH